MKIKLIVNPTIALVMLLSWAQITPDFLTGADQTNRLHVDTPLDSNNPEYQACTDAPQDCSLRGAISRSNADPKNMYYIDVPGFLIAFSLPGSKEDNNNSGDLDLYGTVELYGPGAVLHGNWFDRVMHIHPGAHIYISETTIMGGKSSAGGTFIDGAEPGGGIYNAGILSLGNVTILENSTGEGSIDATAGDGGHGGGIFNVGSLEIQGSHIVSNTTGSGGCSTYSSGTSGSSGSGAGIYNLGYLSLIESVVQNNAMATTICGTMFDPYYGSYAIAGKGAGIYNAGQLDIADSKILSNIAGNPGGIGGGIYSSGTLRILWSEISENSSGDNEIYVWNDAVAGSGAGIFISAGSALILFSTIRGNKTGSGQDGGHGKYGYICGRSGGDGGGIYTAGELTIIDSYIEFNLAGNGGRGCSSGGDGAGIYNTGYLEIAKTQIASNNSGTGGDADYSDWDGPIPGGSGGRGAGIFNSGNLLITNARIAGNRNGDGGGDCIEPTSAGSGGSGGGIYNSGILSMAHSSIITNTTGTGGANCFPGGSGGEGGGFYNTGSMEASYSSILNNDSGSGGIGGDAVNNGGDGGAGGNGGGGFNAGILSFRGVTLMENVAGAGGLPGSAETPGEPGSDGSGGGLFIVDSSTVNLDSTLTAQNRISEFGIGSGMLISGTVVSLVDNTLARNIGGDGSGIHAIRAQLSLINTLLVSHTVGITSELGSVIDLNTTLWGTGIWSNILDWGGTGLVTHQNDLVGDPGFIAPQMGDYHIGYGSTAVDQGTLISLSGDLDDQPIPNPDTGIPDIGADEIWELVPISSVRIGKPEIHTTYMPITFTAQISPTNATPHVYYYWHPEPEEGQYTSTARYFFQNADIFDYGVFVSLTATNAGGTVSDADIFWLEESEFKIFLPIISG